MITKRLIAVAALMIAALSARADVPFIEDNYDRALTQAKDRNVPIFVETWAPW